MNFFEHQQAAKKRTSALVGLMIAALCALILLTTIAISSVGLFSRSYFSSAQTLEQPSLAEHYLGFLQTPAFWYISLGVLGVVVVGSIFKWTQVGRGGTYVAEALGGRLLSHDTRDADEKRVLNVVEEMAIASGNAVPPVYLMEDDSINAFAAGLSRRDAVVGVTRGCIAKLNRDELQGVMAHEFSHIHNGDMRLNLKLIAFIHGIVVIGLIGRMLMYSRGFGSSRNKGAGAQIALAFSLMAIGFGGTFFANIIKAMVSRQREFLADASAVQFTRNPDGISGALKKIGGHPAGAVLKSKGASEFSHMFFGQGIAMNFSRLMATHPPLADRIRRIEPNWDGNFLAQTRESRRQDKDQTTRDKSRASVVKDMGVGVATVLGAGAVLGNTNSKSENNRQASTSGLIDSTGEASEESLALTQAQIASLPTEVLNAAHNPYSARALIYCLFLDTEREARLRQIDILSDAANPTTFEEMRRLYQFCKTLDRSTYLLVVDICMPALKQLSASQRETFKKNMLSLVREDGKVSLLEWCLFRIVLVNIEPVRVTEHKSLSQCRQSAQLVLSATAMMSEARDRDAAYQIAAGALSIKDLPRTEDYALNHLEQAVNELASLKPMEKPKLLKAIMEVIKFDKKATPEEAELFRAIADVLDCPVAPFYAANYLK